MLKLFDLTTVKGRIVWALWVAFWVALVPNIVWWLWLPSHH